MDIDKNDVSISSLFKWNTAVSILGPRGEELRVLYLRLIGDADLNRARVFALRESSKMRKALKTPGTDEYEGFISQIKEQDKEILIKLITLYSITQFGEESRKEVDIKFPTEPSSDSTQEEHENYQKEIDDFPTKFADEADKILKKKIKQEEKRLTTLDENELKKEYINSFINFMCQQEMTNKFTDMCIYLGTYRDKKFKHHAFVSWDDFNNAAFELKDQLRKAYSKLEITIPEIKKLPEATPSQLLGALPKDNG
jgi:hypothetical protein